MYPEPFQHVFFEPNIGSNYGTEKSLFKKRILILGDSHYCDDDCPARDACGNRLIHPNCTSFTQEIIGMYLNQDYQAPWKKTYTTFINSLIQRESSTSDKIAAFESVVFYNYLQVAAGETAASASAFNARYGDDSNLIAFKEVLSRTAPEIVICWGNRVWDTLPNDWGYGEADKGKGITIGSAIFSSYYTYPHNKNSILLIGVHHPSVGYRSRFHSDLFEALGVN